MTTDELRELRPGDRLMVNPTTPPDKGSWLNEQAIFVSFMEQPETGIPFAVVVGLPPGWDGIETESPHLRVIATEQIVGRLREAERFELLRRQLRQMARVLA